jgi:hypothetical protein
MDGTTDAQGANKPNSASVESINKGAIEKNAAKKSNRAFFWLTSFFAPD